VPIYSVRSLIAIKRALDPSRLVSEASSLSSYSAFLRAGQYKKFSFFFFFFKAFFC